MCYMCIIAFTGGLVGSEIIYLWLDPVIQSSNPVQQSSPQSNPANRDGHACSLISNHIQSMLKQGPEDEANIHTHSILICMHDGITIN